jgi:hypothetical protein
MQILELAVFSHDGRVRRLTFKPGALNVITGGSKTGKSAIQQIVEYCLGNGTCEVPAGVIWNSVSWYALLLQMDGSRVFIARKHPDPGYKSSAAVHIEIGSDLEVLSFEALRGNSTPEQSVDQLSRLLGISPNLNVPATGTRSPIEAGLKHSRLLLFQSQSEIASQKFLFHRQGEQFIPQAIRDTLPYFLGAVPEDLLAKQRELKLAKEANRAALREIEAARAVAGQGLERGFVLLSEAEDAGLLEPATETLSPTSALERLRSVATWRMSQNLPAATNQRAVELWDEISQLRQRAGQLRDEMKSAKKLAGEVGGFGREVAEQAARLEPLGLVAAGLSEDNRCPICLSKVSEAVPTVVEMRNSLARVSSQLQAVQVERPRLMEVIANMESEALSLGNQINERRRAYESAAAQQEEFATAAEADNRRAHVVGRISLYLESIPSGTGTDFRQLEANVERTRANLEAIERWFDELDLEERLAAAMNLIGRSMSTFANDLLMEWRNRPMRLDLKKLTVTADHPTDPVTMDRMGSAENWLACHLIAHLALHEYFVTANRPVPRFLMLDQPTQVYYPPERDVDGSLGSLDNEDQEAVRRIFSVLMDFAERLSPALQVIVTDHADLGDERFQAAIVERWRGDLKLIPLDWPVVAA